MAKCVRCNREFEKESLLFGEDCFECFFSSPNLISGKCTRFD